MPFCIRPILNDHQAADFKVVSENFKLCKPVTADIGRNGGIRLDYQYAYQFIGTSRMIGEDFAKIVNHNIAFLGGGEGINLTCSRAGNKATSMIKGLKAAASNIKSGNLRYLGEEVGDASKTLTIIQIYALGTNVYDFAAMGRQDLIKQFTERNVAVNTIVSTLYQSGALNTNHVKAAFQSAGVTSI